MTEAEIRETRKAVEALAAPTTIYLLLWLFTKRDMLEKKNPRSRYGNYGR